MNRQINHLAVVALVLLVACIVGTTYWQTWAVGGLAARQDNEIQRVAQFEIKRGLIYASDGKTVLAANVPRQVGGHTFYFRRYPQRGLYAHLVGYSTVARSQAGLEASENDYLTGSNSNLNTVLSRTLDRLRGVTVKGNSLVLTIRQRAQRVAMNALAGRCGAVVALEPSTGKVLVLVSSPTYDPNLVEKHFNAIRPNGACKGSAPLLNRATDGLFTPGSTFKLLTASAALDSGRFTPQSPFYDPGYCTEYGKPVYNAGNPDQGGSEVFGSVTFAEGLQHSINSVFCNIGKAIGAEAILRYTKRYGFYSVPPLETPVNERAPSGLYNGSKLFVPKHPETQVDPGRLAFGQERMLASPLQMAMVAATIANGGVVMRPHVVEKALTPSGKTLTTFGSDKLGRAVKPGTAQEITQMMVAAVQSGTGTNAQIPGVEVAGKTGTAETGTAGLNNTWFVCFAPAQAPKVAVAVVLEQQHGFGNQFAAPVAKQVLEAILARGSNSNGTTS